MFTKEERYKIGLAVIAAREANTSEVDAAAECAVHLMAAREGTMTAARLDAMERVLVGADGPLGAQLASGIRESFATLGARNAVLATEIAQLKDRLREYHSDVDGDDIKYAEKYDGVHGIVQWVKESKKELAQTKAGIFDTGLRCVSEGGEVFYFDPEELEAVTDRVATLEEECAKRMRMAEEQEGRAARAESSRDSAYDRLATLERREHAHLATEAHYKSTIDAIAKERDDANRRLVQLRDLIVRASALAVEMATAAGEPTNDAATPGHPEQVKEQSEEFIRSVVTYSPLGASAWEQGAKAMRSACWEAIQPKLDALGVDATTREFFKRAIEGAAP